MMLKMETEGTPEHLVGTLYDAENGNRGDSRRTLGGIVSWMIWKV